MAKETGEKRRALGRGLEALLPAAAQAAVRYEDRSIFSCAIEKIAPQKGQPRQHFDETALAELASSIREHGLLEPLVVRRISPGADRFELIAGERRWRASQRAGLKEVLVVVKDVSPKSAFELALIENVQREDLNAIELAEALERLTSEHGYTQEALATRLGKDRSTIANSLRLLKLPPLIRTKVIVGELTEGHARALLGIESDKKIAEIADKVVRGKLSVRATEDLARGAKATSGRAGAKKLPGAGAADGPGGGPGGKNASVRDLEARLARALGTKVLVRDAGNKGEIAIPYADLDALDRLLERLLGEA